MDTLLSLVVIAAFTKSFSLLDKIIAYYGYAKPYYAVHVVHNVLIVAATATSVVRAFTDFYTIFSHPIDWLAAYLCFALHAYHIMDYWRVFQFDDWLHHGLMIGVALPLGCISSSGSLLGMNLFFTTGLPGGLSYALLFAERNGWITREQEKKINVPIHVWIRAPGCVAHAALTTAAVLSSPHMSMGQATIALLVAVLTYWNGQYFMLQVVAAAHRPRLTPSTEERVSNTGAGAPASGNNTVPNHHDGNEAHEQ
jgi:hypothetical protein